MVLGHIERGTHLYIYEERDNAAISEAYEAEFRYLESDTSFVARCALLCEHYGQLDRKACLNISFMTGPYINSFTGYIKETQRGGVVLIEQTTDIVSRNRRQTDRDEIRVHVWLYELPESDLGRAFYEKPAGEAIMSDTTFDVSIGGLCIITNKLLASKSDPCYLLEFSLRERDNYVLPGKLVRRSNYSRTSIGRYDYGFQFMLENMHDEAARLEKGIIYRKISMARN